MIARFEGGPADGYESAVIGTIEPPGYFLLMPAPEGVAMEFVIVGIDFDDHWPGQERYQRSSVLAAFNEQDALELVGVVYAHVPTITCPRCRMTSANPHDIEQGYCGNCHAFVKDRP